MRRHLLFCSFCRRRDSQVALSLSGPWLAVLVAAVIGLVTGLVLQASHPHSLMCLDSGSARN